MLRKVVSRIYNQIMNDVLEMHLNQLSCDLIAQFFFYQH